MDGIQKSVFMCFIQRLHFCPWFLLFILCVSGFENTTVFSEPLTRSSEFVLNHFNRDQAVMFIRDVARPQMNKNTESYKQCLLIFQMDGLAFSCMSLVDAFIQSDFKPSEPVTFAF